jgi:cytosine/adenosine deaminase-related metal-dependent hydrolase
MERCGALNRSLLAAHVNYLGRGDVARLAKHQVNVVHCPRSHSYFSHGPFPLQRLVRARVNICLGTDSLASVYKTRRQNVELNMFEEMRVLSDREKTLSARSIVRIATVNGAKAFGLEGRAGELSPGAWADIITLPFSGNFSNPYDAVLQHQGHVSGSMINGRWTILAQ